MPAETRAMSMHLREFARRLQTLEELDGGLGQSNGRISLPLQYPCRGRHHAERTSLCSRVADLSPRIPCARDAGECGIVVADELALASVRFEQLRAPLQWQLLLPAEHARELPSCFAV